MKRWSVQSRLSAVGLHYRRQELIAMPHFDSRRSDLPDASAGELAAEHLQPFGSSDDFEDEPTEGVSIDSFEPGTVLAVTTRNNRYRLTLLDHEGHALITGGKLFPNPTDVRIQGATVRGIIPKFGWIVVGAQLELSVGNRLILTSPVQSVQPLAA
jgi:hypothetical protein